jgi:hypothetical protein
LRRSIDRFKDAPVCRRALRVIGWADFARLDAHRRLDWTHPPPTCCYSARGGSDTTAPATPGPCSTGRFVELLGELGMRLADQFRDVDNPTSSDLALAASLAGRTCMPAGGGSIMTRGAAPVVGRSGSSALEGGC